MSEDSPYPYNSDRPKSIFRGCLSFLILLVALTALIIALLSWADVPAPEKLKSIFSRFPTQKQDSQIESTEEKSKSMISDIRSRLEDARREINEPQKKDRVLNKLGEVKNLFTGLAQNAKPKLQDTYQSLSEKTSGAMKAVRESANDARDRLENLVQDFNTIQDDKGTTEE